MELEERWTINYIPFLLIQLVILLFFRLTGEQWNNILSLN